jgi:hypothetical protein
VPKITFNFDNKDYTVEFMDLGENNGVAEYQLEPPNEIGEEGQVRILHYLEEDDWDFVYHREELGEAIVEAFENGNHLRETKL